MTKPKRLKVTRKPARAKDRFPYGETGTAYGMFRTPEGHKRAVDRCLRALRPVVNTFDVLYVTGLSGTVPAAVVAYILNKPLLILRKTVNDTSSTASHGALLEGYEMHAWPPKPARIMIIDDFISGGTTLARMMHYLHENHTVVGVCLYAYSLKAEKFTISGLRAHAPADAPLPYIWRITRRGRGSMIFDIKKEPTVNGL